MEGIPEHSRLRTLAVAALLASGLVLMAMSGSTSAMSGSKRSILKDISLGIRNSSATPIQAQICRNAQARHPNKEDKNPCDEITQTHVIQPGHRYIAPNSNPVGVIITCAPGSCPDPDTRKTLNFYASNENLLFLPYFVAEGEMIHLDVHRHADRTRHDVHFELRRYADENRDGEHVKLMRIEIRHWPADVHNPCKRRVSRAALRPPGC